MSDSGLARKLEAQEHAPPKISDPVRLVCIVLLVGAGYYAGTLLGKALRFPDSHLSLIWPPTAILLAALLLAPTRVWWIYLLAVTPVHLFAQLQDGVPPWGILSQLAGNFSQALLAATSVRYFNKDAPLFSSFRSIVVFTLGAVILAPLIVSTIVAYLYVLSGWEQDYGYAWRARILSNALSTLIFVPPIILLFSRGATTKASSVKFYRYVEMVVLLILLVVTSSISFGNKVEELLGVACPIILPLPVLLWLALRFGLEGLCLSTLLVAYCAFASTAAGQGFFAMSSPAKNVLSVQFYLIVTTLPLMWLAVLIQERREKQDALREREQRYLLATTAGVVGVWDWNLTTNEIYLDPALKAILGFREDEITNHIDHWVRRVHPADVDRVMAEARAHIDNATPYYEVEHRMLHKDGSIRWFLTRGSALKREAGKAVRMVGTDTDITERKQADEELRKSEERYRAIVEDQTELICRLSPDGTYSFVNEACCRYFGKTREELIGHKFWPFVHADDEDSIRKFVAGFGPNNRIGTIEHRVRSTGGEERWNQWTDRALFDEQGRLIEFQCVGRDITERKRAERALKEALEEVQKLKERLEAENVYLRTEVSAGHRYGEIIGRSEAVQKVWHQVKQVAVTDMTVLILGETGTGKELIARAVHANSTRRDRPLVKVNCSALPSELIESELFGHEKGAFTGAMARQAGRFELADGGTIFLDEVGDLPLSLQAKLLRVLQEGEFERLGSGKTISVNVRVIAATNRDLEQALHDETFRSDLYYRLNVYPIHLPPLRERKDDIELLAGAFLKEASQRLGRKLEAIPENVLETFQRYDWPGNVRELQNVIERAAVVSTGPSLELPETRELGAVVTEAQALAGSKGSLDHSVSAPLVPGATLEELERAHIIRVLMETRWRVEGPKGAAVILGLHPSTLRSRMQRLGIQKTNP